jgi:parallel beta-helix repeat protein
MDHPSPSIPATELPALDRRLLLGAAGLAGVAALAIGRAPAGPLNPPAGAVAPTGKTLTDVEPRTAINAANTPGDATNLFVISQPGSYYLTGNVTVPNAFHFLRISASHVTVDLCGFVVSGAAGSVTGIQTGAASPANLTIRNGVIRNMGNTGILINGGSNAIVASGLVVSNCLGAGMILSDYATIEGCTSVANAGVGIQAGLGSVIRSCTAAENGASGLSVSTGSLVESCSAHSNVANGIVAAIGSTVRACGAYSNDSSGISVSSNCTVESCTAAFNAANGIIATTANTIRNNTCNDNGDAASGAGVRVSGGNRVEGNHCVSNFRGVYASGTGNLIVRNTCGGNTGDNYFLVASNRYGPIIDLTAAGAAGVAGSAAAGTLTSSDSNANYSV